MRMASERALPALYFVGLGSLLCLVALATFIFYVTGSEATLLMGGGLCALGIIIFPQFVRRSQDPFEPLNFIALTTFIGVTSRTIYVVATADSNAHTRDFLLLGKSLDVLSPAMLLICLALACLVCGYSLKVPRVRVETLPMIMNDDWNKTRLVLALFTMALVAALSIGLYFEATGITLNSLSDRFSAKRKVLINDATYGVASLGYYLWGASLLSYVFLILHTLLATSRKSFFSPLGFSVVVSGAAAAILPIITSSRNDLLLLIVYAALIWHYKRSKLSLQTLLNVLAIALTLLFVLGGMRAVSQGQQEALSSYLTDNSLIEGILGSRNWFDITSTAHVVDSVPQKLDYLYGQSLFSWVVAPVPRRIWKEKPVVRIGDMIGQVIFNRRHNITGVPPGYIGELYINFGVPGVLLGMFLLGAFLKTLYVSFKPYLARNKNLLLIYIYLLVNSSLRLMAGDVSGTIIPVLMSLITLHVFILFVKRTPQKVGAL